MYKKKPADFESKHARALKKTRRALKANTADFFSKPAAFLDSYEVLSQKRCFCYCTLKLLPAIEGEEELNRCYQGLKISPRDEAPTEEADSPRHRK
ncbi:hypothetical protein M1B74_11325 [Bacteroides pyogenes]|uniref:hypothetical protein n=1 Tax=Bacteroides pyogenes TaxID=310300 RepID=UPI003B433B19